jgi:hypothetical protein
MHGFMNDDSMFLKLISAGGFFSVSRLFRAYLDFSQKNGPSLARRLWCRWFILNKLLLPKNEAQRVPLQRPTQAQKPCEL